ncbi:hypothetical protein PMIN04_011021 [Paraphaeosphaeria minitans]
MRSSASRSPSPQRQITQLRIAHPPIFIHPLATAAEGVTPAVAPRIRALQTPLQHQLEREYIPACLRDALERDPTYKASLLFDPIDETAYYNDEEEDVDVVLVLESRQKPNSRGRICARSILWMRMRDACTL